MPGTAFPTASGSTPASSTAGFPRPRRPAPRSRGLVPLRRLPQRALRDRPDDRRRLPLGARPHPATGTVTGPDRPESQTLDQSASSGSVTGAVGGYAYGWITKRLVTRGDFLYIKVSPGRKTRSVTDRRIGTDYYVFRNAGLGVQYKYNKYSEVFSAQSNQLGGKLVFKGFQVVLSFLF